MVAASLVAAQTPDAAQEPAPDVVTIDPGYSVGWFDCVWREDTLYVATREQFGYYLKLSCYADGRLSEIARAPRRGAPRPAAV